ncbi:hypothetical protein BRC96_00880 [Halobacteriales archaeon QS_6_64_34]|nr:MAG: hypothetical protein BRC96_00880 [Halobacteriales archaeon QS_6_64_34]
MSISTDLIYRLAEKTSKDPSDLPPLADVVDPTVLERVVESADDSVDLDFRYLDHEVTVSGDGTVRVNERHE